MIDTNTHISRYTLKAKLTPLPKSASAQKDHLPALTSHPYDVRAENEDDDGYDPYSDYHPQPDFFEADPWD